MLGMDPNTSDSCTVSRDAFLKVSSNAFSSDLWSPTAPHKLLLSASLFPRTNVPNNSLMQKAYLIQQVFCYRKHILKLKGNSGLESGTLYPRN